MTGEYDVGMWLLGCAASAAEPATWEDRPVELAAGLGAGVVDLVYLHGLVGWRGLTAEAQVAPLLAVIPHLNLVHGTVRVGGRAPVARAPLHRLGAYAGLRVAAYLGATEDPVGLGPMGGVAWDVVVVGPSGGAVELRAAADVGAFAVDGAWVLAPNAQLSCLVGRLRRQAYSSGE